MKLLLALVLSTSAATAAPPEICSGVARETEPDMQIRETDLDHASAVAAARWLHEKLQEGSLGGDYQFGALNQLKIIKGHMLLQQALDDRKDSGVGSVEAAESRNSFCNWLVKDGFWYD
jgi:hypothetical protein